MTSSAPRNLPSSTNPATTSPPPVLVTQPQQASQQCQPSPAAPEATFAGLPTEIHLLITKQLIYPDALSLKHTNRYFYSLVDTGIKLKVAWLMERRMLHLDCPNDRRCILRTDLEFCRGSVRLLMQRRREHIECESRPGLGCLVYGTPVCSHRRDRKALWKRWMRRQITVELWWIVLAAIPLLFGWLWMAELSSWFLSNSVLK